MKLEMLNELLPDEAFSRFLDCCGSRKWARKMTEARPFADVGDLLLEAERIWRGLEPADWLEAFAAHPKIGAKKAAPAQQARSAEWSKGEQAGMDNTDETVREELADANRLYEGKFGHIFIVCATGKSAGEMLGLCRQRLENGPDSELRTAAKEQRKITEIRLIKLVNEEEEKGSGGVEENGGNEV
jgi:OHCU decarboxylase